MLCDIARNLKDDNLERIKALENDLGLTIVAFSCRSLDPAREERLRALMAELGPQLQAEPAERRRTARPDPRDRGDHGPLARGGARLRRRGPARRTAPRAGPAGSCTTAP